MKVQKIAFFTLLVLIARGSNAQQPSEPDGSRLLDSIRVNQEAIEGILLSDAAGEGITGFLIPKDSGGLADTKTAIESENLRRAKLYQLMAEKLNISPEEVGRQRAARYAEKLVPGIRREVSLTNGSVVWWNGEPPDPRNSAPPGPGESKPVLAVPRVLTIEGAKIYNSPSKEEGIARGNLPKFSAYQVIQEQKKGTSTWFQVSSSALPDAPPANWRPKPLGWIPDDEVIPWKHSLVMEFTSQNGRRPSLFFRDDKGLENLIGTPLEKRQQELEKIEKALETTGKTPEGMPVLAREPHVDFRAQKEAYIIPITDFREVQIDGLPAKLLKLAATASNVPEQVAKVRLNIDVVFVMDTSGSMGPYLRGMLEAVRQLSGEIKSVNDQVRFGFVGYRDDVARTPELEYTTRNFTPGLQDISTFATTLSEVKAMDYPTKDDIPEAVFEGVEDAIVNSAWRENSVRVVIVAGDAPGHPRQSRGNLCDQDEETLRKEGANRKIALFALQIINSKYSGKAEDSLAQRQFEELCRSNENGTVRGVGNAQYWSLDASNAREFQSAVIENLREIKNTLQKLDQSGSENPDEKAKGVKDPGAEKFRLMLENAYVDWLARQNNEPPPKFIEGWASERVITHPARSAMIPKILLTRAQLNELSERLKELLDAGRQAKADGASTTKLFDLMVANSGWTLVNPSADSMKDAFRIPLDLDRLPYRSRMLTLSNDEWRAMRGDQQDQYFFDWQRMIKHYANLIRDTDGWKPLVSDAAPEDYVIGLELDMLP
jgi:serine/threonine-protein kinase PpkA